MIPPLKIKPPPIQWPPLATFGLMASVGSYVGTTLFSASTNPLIWLLLSMVILATGLCLQQRCLRTLTISTSLFFIFLASSTRGEQLPAWVSTLHNDLCELDCQVMSEPILTPRTIGAMHMFDHREPNTRFVAKAAPSRAPQAIPIEIEICINKSTRVKYGERLRCVGWLHESSRQQDAYTLYMSNNPQTLNPQTAVDQRGNVRSVIQHSLLNKLQPKEKTLANALFFGIRDAGWTDVSNRFRHAGMSHILAISGLHIGLFLLVATRLCTGVGTRPTWNMVVVLMTVLLIISIIESRAPMVRSVVMATIIASGKMIGLRCSSVGLLGVSAILFLVFKPKDAGTITFQLTFIVVASLCVLLPQIQWRILGPGNPNAPTRTLASRGLATVWLTGMCAWCVASPITAHLFGSLSPSGIVSSVPSIALLFTTIVLGVAKVALGWLSPAIEQLLVVVFTFSLHELLSLAILCGKLPFAHIHPISFSWAQSTTVLMWVVLWSLLRKNRALLWVALPIVCCFVLVKTTTSTTVITTVHVGHGTCHIIQNSNHTTLIDAGSRGNLDIGSRVLVPKLRSLGVSTINTLIITHADLDHLAGIIDVMQSYPIQKIVIAPQTMGHTTPPLEAVLREALLHQIQIVCGVVGWVEHKESLCFSIISPTQTDEYYSSNASSIVLLLKTHGRSVLFTGDIDERGITKIMNSRLGTIDVVELPHHGQWSEEAQRCIHTLLPRVVIQSTNISRYKKDRWTIPRDTVRFVTAIDGDITTTISAEGVLTVTGSNHPATMAPCVFTNRVSPLSQQ